MVRDENVPLCQRTAGCVYAADYDHNCSAEKVWQFQCPHGVPNFGWPCEICG